MSARLAHYPVRLVVPVAWGEMDSMRHVNNIVYFRWFESARFAYFERIAGEHERPVPGGAAAVSHRLQGVAV